MSENMNCADVAAQAREMFAQLGDKVDGIEWEAAGRVFSIHRSRPNEVAEYTGEALARYRTARADYQRRHPGLTLVPGQADAFQLGERWYSYDNGGSWTRQQIAVKTSAAALVVTKIDRARGEVTFGVSR